MIASSKETKKGSAAAAAMLLALSLSAGCTQSLVERVIDARGGALPAYRKEVRAVVHEGIPGRWEWEVAYRYPESFRWSLETWGESQRLLFDGVTARHQIGSATLPPSGDADASIRSQARWFAVTSLDVLKDERVTWREIPSAELPVGTTRGLAAEWKGYPARYELFFDDRDLLVRARGPVGLEPVGTGLLDASFSDYRTVDGFRLPFSARYQLGGAPLMEEAVLRWVPGDPALVEGFFSAQ